MLMLVWFQCSIEEFCAWVRQRFARLDVLINNACQTVRRPAAYYKHLIEGECIGSKATLRQVRQLFMDGASG
jgi:hypothetical protein